MWKALPLPEFLLQLQQRQMSSERSAQFQQSTSGKYWCTVNEFRHDQQPFYFKRYACSEKPQLEGYAFTLGVLDASTKRLYARYAM